MDFIFTEKGTLAADRILLTNMSFHPPADLKKKNISRSNSYINNAFIPTTYRYPSQLPTSTTGFCSNIGELAFREYNVGNFQASEKMCNEWILEQGETAECCILLAMINMKFRKLDKAIRFCEKAMSLNVSLSEPYIFKALIYKEKGLIVEAINYFLIAIQIRPENPDPYMGIANCYLLINNLDTAIQYCCVALQKQPESLVCRQELGTMLKLSGKFEDAKKCFDQVLEKKPDYAIAWLNLGHIHSAMGATWLALHHFEKALQYDPYMVDTYLAFGNLLKEIKLIERSIQIYLKALSVFPNNPLLYGSLAGAYYEQGLTDLAIDTYRHSIALMPNYPDAYCNLANALKEKGMIKEAEQYYNIAICLCPTHADSFNNLANIYREQGKVKESIELYRKALEISPNFAAAHSNIATVLQQCGNLTDAIQHYQRAVNANPSYPEGHCFLGNALKEIGNYKAAIECYMRAIQINPCSPDAHAFLGTVYKDSGNIVEAIHAFKISLKFRSNFSEVFCNLIHCYQLICDWNGYEERMQKLISIVSEQLEKNRPPTVHPHHTMLYPLTFAQSKCIANRHSIFCLDRISFLGLKIKTHSNNKFTKGKRIKVGYVSSDFCNHPTSHLIQSIPGLHDNKIIEVFCYSLIASDDSSFRRKIESEVEHFRDVSKITDFGEIANMIVKDGINILLNLNGYTKGARNEIFALKPAPIQIMYLGYPGTSGASYMDYIITDKFTSPIEHEDHYSEKFAYMPNSFFIGDHANMFPHILQDLTADSSISSTVSTFTDQFSASSSWQYPVSDLRYIYNDKTMNEYIDFHSKKRIEETIKCKNSGERIPDRSNWTIDRQTLLIPSQSFVFCNFNQLYKLDPKTFSSWCKILMRVPESVIWLLRFPKAGEQNLRDTAKKLGIQQNRLIFTEVASKEEHVRRGQLADVCLDTPLCNGHTTGMDVLWAGCPIVTMPLNTFASRVGSSIISSIGCEELIVKTYEEYEDLAVRLATDKNFYKKIKNKIWYNRISSSLFNVKKYTADFDALLHKIWCSYEKNNKIVHILDSSTLDVS
ncbi:hypothetical protein HZS_2145 [Henneguya salminicola]|nr:hypothetical protein HZS_2145 [Henneguya salminicola]